MCNFPEEYGKSKLNIYEKQRVNPYTCKSLYDMKFGPSILTDDGPRLGRHVSCTSQLGLYVEL